VASWFTVHNASRIFVDVDPDNAPARAFYTSHGAVELNFHWLVWNDIKGVLGER
jgi:hypothetical protein